MATSEKSVFATLNAVNVNENTKEKNGLTYLSWSWAWAEVKKRFPEANYEIIKFDGIPYVFDPKTGFMVFTRVTICNITHEMCLPVLDSNNFAMKDAPYEVQTKFKKFSVKAATMFDVNKSIMRCLVKNLAMFGLGLYIYSGEDLPEDEHADQDNEKPQQQKQKDATQHVTCAFCGKPITGGKVNGKTVTARAVMDKSMEVYGELFCYPCMVKKADEKANAAKGNE